MSKHHDHDEHARGATTIRASKGGGGGKLLLGVVAAAILLGGGYYAWSNYAPQNGAQTGYNESYATDPYDDPLRAGPLGSSEADDASEEQLAATASSESAPAPPRRSQARAEPIPEATIGVTPANVTEEDMAAAESSDLVVTAPIRPIWARTPSERRLASYYPARALERGREGEARLACTVMEGGSLACDKLSETPGGFGNAALRVSRSLRHAAVRSDGSDATGTPVNLRVVFRIDEENRRS
ncbi:MAG: hypothetical protein AB7G40_04020 [Hyphomonadaceae bacterium]